jgi:hypothetical protein
MIETANNQSYRDQLPSRCIEYPAMVSIEAFAYCNAGRIIWGICLKKNAKNI